MDYQFENLDPERFQQFCQALLVHEFPNVQCFPVAQPDGGRDAILYIQPGKTFHKTIVFQVKFVRKPQVEKSSHQQLINALEKEIPKVRTLIKEGTDEYYLLTNVPGTAHLEAGSIDRVNMILREALDIPAYCWWRDDLSRRLDNAWNLKWVYPELISGLDMLRQIIESGLTENQARRTSAIRSFIRTQYDTDHEVRFKQIELQNKLLDLFIDVPLNFGHGKDERRQHSILHYIAFLHKIEAKGSMVYQSEETSSDVAAYNIPLTSYDLETVGAGTFFLHPFVQENIPQVVLEGAPGQGKSTIAQYICQVHRMYILEKRDELEGIPSHLRPSSIRIPFKVDLRDLATWLNRQNPFSSNEENLLPENWHKSLEAFLAFQVKTLSGGIDFSIADLHAVGNLSAFLLVLDGLDEVADISKRKEIVGEIKAGVNRLRESCASLQVIITSRPAAFVNSPGFPESSYPHYELVSITKPLIYEYVKKWSKARKLNNRDSADVRRILTEKLDQPHLRDLARNPMQLAILLSLIHARGSSLPDKRTALYDNYVELFFSRESDKSAVVREYRDLLIDIHRFLAWILHSEAEQGHDRGSISSDKLRRLLTEYLVSEEYNPSLVDKLFSGMVERVVALVSRVQGTYEFEVQPLREYFVARYLYETAPYSPPGAERKGTKPDRFEAIARNFYWLNVTRFYAGCFSKGELPALVDSLEALIHVEGYRNTSHPRILAAMLLSDWVFTQNQRSMKQVVKLILDGLGLRSVLVFKNRHQAMDNALILPRNCGLDELLEQCFSILRNKPVHDYAREVIELIKLNAVSDEIKGLWYKEISTTVNSERTRWLEYGLHLGLLAKVSLKDLEYFFEDNTDTITRLKLVFRARQIKFCEATKERRQVIIHAVLNGDLIAPRFKTSESALGLFSQALNTSTYSILQTNHSIPSHIRLSEAGRFYPGILSLSDEYLNKIEPFGNSVEDEDFNKCLRTISIVSKEQQRPLEDWRNKLSPWNTMIEDLRAIWGDQWIFFHLANIASSIDSSKHKELYQDFPNLLDQFVPLCFRICYAISKAYTANWWIKQFAVANTELEYMFVSLVILTWGSNKVLIDIVEVLDSVFRSLPADRWQTIIKSVQETTKLSRKHTSATLLDADISKDLSERTIVAIGMRTRKEQAGIFYLKYLADYCGSDQSVLEFCQDAILNLTKTNPNYWEQALTIIANNYSRGIIFDRSLIHTLTRDTEANILPLKIAKEVTGHPEAYPRYLVTYAEAKCREVVAAQIIPVGEIAKRDEWFISE